MEISELKENKVVDNVKDPAVETATRQRFIIKFHDILCFLRRYMVQNKYTLEDLHQQVIDKKSYLSKFQRDFLIAWKLDFIQDCLNEMTENERKSRERNLLAKSS